MKVKVEKVIDRRDASKIRQAKILPLLRFLVSRPGKKRGGKRKGRVVEGEKKPTR